MRRMARLNERKRMGETHGEHRVDQERKIQIGKVEGE